ncbi:MAG TPA: recombinase family protein [Ktedonobacteraceae bacterium]|nr:recombinase family protein [Ktedonobacteraceae bacterium]
MRKITPPPSNGHQEWKPPTLRTQRKGAVYARRSDPTARKKETDTSQSREMQTEDLLAWATGKSAERLNPCWNEEDLEPYFADLGLSGTLRPDERPDMLRLFDDIDRGMYDHGTVICFQESRLFRDETQIYYNQFIKKCKDHDIVVVVVSPFLMIYDFQDEFLTEMFRWKCKEAGEFIKWQVRGWMLPARERAAKQGMWAGMGDISIGYVVDIDPKNPTYKRFVVYEPHAKIVRYIFIRYADLCGNLTALIREITVHPIVFPPLSEEDKQRYYLKNGIMNRSGGKLSTREALTSILTNRIYLGWRIVSGVVVKKDSHDAIVDQELFNFAFMSLTGYDIHGNEVETELKEKRYYRTIPERAALLKDVVTSETGRVYVKMMLDKSTRKYTYVPNGKAHGFWRVGQIEMIDIEKLDVIIVERLLFHAQSITDLPAYNEIIAQSGKRSGELSNKSPNLLPISRLSSSESAPKCERRKRRVCVICYSKTSRTWSRRKKNCNVLFNGLSRSWCMDSKTWMKN